LESYWDMLFSSCTQCSASGVTSELAQRWNKARLGISNLTSTQQRQRYRAIHVPGDPWCECHCSCGLALRKKRWWRFPNHLRRDPTR